MGYDFGGCGFVVGWVWNLVFPVVFAFACVACYGFCCG